MWYDGWTSGWVVGWMDMRGSRDDGWVVDNGCVRSPDCQRLSITVSVP